MLSFMEKIIKQIMRYYIAIILKLKTIYLKFKILLCVDIKKYIWNITNMNQKLHFDSRHSFTVFVD